MADYKPRHDFTTVILLVAFFYLQFLSLPVAGDSPAYTPIDNIVLDCGSTSKSSAIFGDSRIWVGDVSSKFFPSDLHPNNASAALPAETPFLSATSAVYTTARLSRSEFTYLFPVSPGPKFIRLYFYSAPYSNFDRSKALFSVKASAGVYTLLHDFNASINADASGLDEIFREFCVYVQGNDEKLDLTFIPTNQDSYAFVSGIEIVSMPIHLYYSSIESNEFGLKLIGQSTPFQIKNQTSLEMVYRINIGGKGMSRVEDTGMFRTWSADYFLDEKVYSRPVNLSIELNYSKIAPYTAPEEVYRTAQTMGPNGTENKSFNLTWEYPVDPGFHYMLRLHFCEIEVEIDVVNLRMFVIYIGDMIAETNADVIRWAGGRGIPCFRDYVVFVPTSSSNKSKVNLSVKLQPKLDESQTKWSNVILNGIEIFKLNDSSGNLSGQNPDYIPPISAIQTPPHSKNSISKVLIVVIPVVVGGVVAILAVGLFVLRRSKTWMNQTSTHGTSWYAPFSISTIKSSNTRSSNLPSDLCRYFSLDEIKAATKDFNDIFIVGIGGFGNVYKGYIDDGATQVAIKRLKPGSKQGANEFKTEIEMLSQLRHLHLHLVSLIGYCNDGNEMILVYDYMTHGTLRSHLYGDDKQPLTWKQRLQICIGAARGLHYLHTGAKHTIIHRDVKTTNILLDERLTAKVSDFGLSKAGPINTSKTHISTVVKGSFGYLDPEYYRRQQLTEKSDVYSFGIVLCEVLCGRPPLMRNTDKKKAYLAEWVRRCNRENRVAQIIDPNVVNEISAECLRKFVEIAVSCIEDDGIKRPSMNDVVWGLEFALQLHEASMKKGGGYDIGGGDGEKDRGEEGWCMSSDVTTINTVDSSCSYNKGLSDSVFSEIKDPTGR